MRRHKTKTMLTVIALSVLNPSYTVIDVNRTEVFAGKLGTKVQQTLTLSDAATKFTVRLSTQHTHCSHSIATFKVGDHVSLKSIPFGGWIDATSIVKN